MSPADIVREYPGLRLVWVDSQPRIMWDGALPTTVVDAIRACRDEVVDALHDRDERAAIQAEPTGLNAGDITAVPL